MALRVEEHEHGAQDRGLTFADGSTVRVTATPTDGVRPGTAFSLGWAVHAGASSGSQLHRLRLTLLPPRVAGRQEVVYGTAKRQPEADPRVRQHEVEIAAGKVELQLPSPWHPRTAVVTVEGLSREGAMVPLREGVRAADGLGVLAVVPVATAPLAVLVPRRAGIVVDGRLEDWAGDGLELVSSLDGEPITTPRSSVRFAWDDHAIFVAAHLDDTDIWSAYRARDEPLWNQEVFEVFLAADGSSTDYLELQVSPRNVVFDARFARHRRGDTAWNSALRSAVLVDGTIDNRADRDTAWTVELAVPWSDVCANTKVACPPRGGLVIRGNAFRFDRPANAEVTAVALTPTRKPDFHNFAEAAVLELQP